MRAANIDDVVTLLDEITTQARAAGTRDGYFSALYAQVTRAVRDATFDDTAWVRALDVAFANRYFDARDRWLAGTSTPRSWQVAFAATARPDLCVLQHLLLGMNAHINYDLGPAAASFTSAAELPGRHADFERVNDVLGALLPKVQAALDRYSPMLDVVDRLGARSDEAIAGFSMGVAREEAWFSAQDEVVAPDRARFEDRLDRRVAVLARTLADPGLPFGPAFQLVRAMEKPSDLPAILDTLRTITL